jgi:hypothetical protein
MNASKTLLALVIATVAPLAANAESPDAITFQDAPATLSAAQVRAEYLAVVRSAPYFGEAYPFQNADVPSARSRAEVRAEVLSMDRRAQRFGEAYPGDVAGEKSARGSTAVHVGLN